MRQASRKRQTLLMWLCWRYIQRFYPGVYRRFKVIAEIEFPPDKGGRYKYKR